VLRGHGGGQGQRAKENRWGEVSRHTVRTSRAGPSNLVASRRARKRSGNHEWRTAWLPSKWCRTSGFS